MTFIRSGSRSSGDNSPDFGRSPLTRGICILSDPLEYMRGHVMKNILVVEDSAIIMELIRFLLTTFGYESKEARDDLKLSKLLKKTGSTLYFLTYSFRDLTGLKSLKKSKPP